MMRWRNQKNRLMNGGAAVLVTAAVVSLLIVISDMGGATASKTPRGFCQIESAEDVLERHDARSVAGTNVSLVVERRFLKPGRTARARLLNLTEKPVSYGAEFKIQRFGQEGWKLDPNSPDGPWKRSAARLAPARAGHCYRFRVPVEQAAGRYRFLTKVDTGARQEPASAEFRITSTP